MNPCASRIRLEISQQGPISFERFMDLALYCPEVGFYERNPYTTGKAGHFFTSVSVGPLFGRLLACQFQEWLEHSPPPGNAQLLEAGAHAGHFAEDVLRYFHDHYPELWPSLRYNILEPSPERRRWQQERLRHFAPKLSWLNSWECIPQGGFEGILFANELLDSMPLRLFSWSSRTRTWHELAVELRNNEFAWRRSPEPVPRPGSPGEPPSLPPELAAVMPEGFLIETCPKAVEWWQRAARTLRRGRLMTIDYGCQATERLLPHRAAGFVRAYRDHQVNSDLLAFPGEQDLTAHVDWTAILEAGTAEGLTTEFFDGQAVFLTRLAERIWRSGSRFGAWSAQDTREFQTLVHPEHLGNRFQVVIQKR